MSERVAARIEHEIGQIDTLLETYSPLLDRVSTGEPDMVEMAAVASVLHGFYNGVENAFIGIAKLLDGGVPSGAHWHSELLSQMAEASATRSTVLSVPMAQRLGGYLAFRHFFRHSYSFRLDWREMGSLASGLRATWEQVRTELRGFASSYGR